MRHFALVTLLLILVVSAGCAGLEGIAEPSPSITEPSVSPSPSAEEPNSPDDTPDGSSNESLTVHTLDVGQGDSMLVVGQTGETMLIDSGDWRDEGDDVIAYLESLGVDRIDYLVTTHPDADHIGGHAAVIEHYETNRDGIGQIWDPGVTSTSATYDRYLDAVEAHDVDLIQGQEGDTIPLEGAEVRVLNPTADSDLEDSNDDSLVLHVTRGERSFLFTGDAETPAETRMTEEYGSELESDVYLGGHHGSATSSTGPFLDAVDPKLAMISSAYDSQYGHPHEETLTRLDERSITTYWTGIHGTTVFESDGETIAVSTQVDATTDPAELNAAPEATAGVTDETVERAVYTFGSDDGSASLTIGNVGARVPQPGAA